MYERRRWADSVGDGARRPPAQKPEAVVYLESASRAPGGIRELSRGRILEVLPQGYGIALPVLPDDLEVGSDLILFYEGAERFVGQPVVVRKMEADARLPWIEVEVAGDPLCADHRIERRLPADGADLRAELGPARCPVLDVSPRGFAVLCSELPASASTVPVVLIHEGARIPGTVAIRNRCILDADTRRYGLCCVPMPDGANLLERALPRIHQWILRTTLEARGGRGL